MSSTGSIELIMGIDPGLAATGYGVIAVHNGSLRRVAHGTIHTASGISIGERLSRIYEGIRAVVHTHRPARAGVESLYFARNASSAIPVAHARGAVILALYQEAVPCTEYPPQIIKRTITDDGRASKEQMRIMVGTLLRERALPAMSAHAVDALATAVCHCNNTVLQFA